MTKRLLLCLALVWGTSLLSQCLPYLSGSLFAQTYRLTRIRPSRFEVTRALDALPDSTATEFIRAYKAGVDSLERPFVGCSAISMTSSRPESLLSNWTADVLVWSGEQQGEHIDMGLCNIGGLRASMPKDTVRMGDILSISPFDNVLSIVRLKGSVLTRLFENIAAAGGEGVSHGTQLIINTAEHKLVSATLHGKPIDPEATYTIATLDYLSDGNDRLTALKDAFERKDTNLPTRELLIAYFHWLNERGEQASAQMEGRIRDVAKSGNVTQ